MNKEQIENAVKAKEGDKQALNSLFEDYKNTIYFYVKNYISNENDIEDVIQETFISAFRSLDKLENPEAFKSWIFKIAYFRAMDFHRKNKSSEITLKEENEGIFENIEDEDAEFIPGEVLEKDETKVYIASLVSELTEEQKTAVLLYYYREMNIAEIAEFMECAEGTIKSRLNYARKYIKGKIEDKQKKGLKVIVVVPIPILTKVLLWQAEQTKLSAEASLAIWSGVESSLISAGVLGSGGVVTGGVVSGGSSTVVSTAAVAGAKTATAVISTKMMAMVAGIVVTAIVGTTAVVAVNSNNKDAIVAEGETQSTDGNVVNGLDETTPPSADEVAEDVLTMDISLLLNPQTESDYAKLYYRFVHDFIMDESNSNSKNFKDADMLDFNGDGKYELVVMEIGEKSPASSGPYAEEITWTVYAKDDILKKYTEIKGTNTGFSFRISLDGTHYISEYKGNPALFLDKSTDEYAIVNILTLDKEYNMIFTVLESYNDDYCIEDFLVTNKYSSEIHDFLMTANETHIPSEEARITFDNRINRLSTMGYTSTYVDDRGTRIYTFDNSDFEITYGERLKEYF